MKIIAHRGNLIGPNPSKENSPAYIDMAIAAGFDVEIDLWADGCENLYLGHDEPSHDVSAMWLAERSNNLWVHCKNIDAAVALNGSNMNYFWHQTDTMTLTSKRYWWVFPGKQPVKGSVAVMPEIYNEDVSECYAICTDYPMDYAEGRR